MGKGLHHSLQLRGHAARMRTTATPSEDALWQCLRAGQLGVHFRRQVPLLDSYIVDFLAVSARLVVEIDGGYHAVAAQRRADSRRDRKLQQAGFSVLRLSAKLVTTDIESAVSAVKTALASVPVSKRNRRA